MSQRWVEALVGRLVCDEGFCDAFFEDPQGAAMQNGFAVTPSELDCLQKIPHHTVSALTRSLDDRIRRAPGAPAAKEGSAMMDLLKKLVRNETAQDLAEYGIALAIIGAGAALAAIAISGYVNTLWTNASIIIGGAV